jgi:hypothetical protein
VLFGAAHIAEYKRDYYTDKLHISPGRASQVASRLLRVYLFLGVH